MKTILDKRPVAKPAMESFLEEFMEKASTIEDRKEKAEILFELQHYAATVGRFPQVALSSLR